MPDPKLIIEIIATIEQVALEFGVEDAYFVGGYPRALAMGLPLSEVHDLDIASGRPQKAMELAGFFAERIKPEDYEILHRTGTVRITARGLEIDFQGSSSHDDVAPYVRMWGVEETPLALNVFDRDFTMNALAIRVGTNEILDVTKRGMPDISDHRIASIIPPDVAVPKNPLMITRAIKFAARYGFGIERNLWKAMVKHVGQLEKMLSPERLAIEAYVLSKYPEADEMLEKLGLKKLESPAMIEKGKEEALAWSIGNQKRAQSNLPTPWEIGLSKGRPVAEPRQSLEPQDGRIPQDIDFQQRWLSQRDDYADLTSRFEMPYARTAVFIGTNGRSRTVMFGRRLLPDWKVRLDVSETVNETSAGIGIRNVSLGSHSARPALPHEGQNEQHTAWIIDFAYGQRFVTLPQEDKLRLLAEDVNIIFNDDADGTIILPRQIPPSRQRLAQSSFPTPWEMGLNRKRPAMPDVHEDFLAERFYVNEHSIEVNVDGGKKTVMFSRRLSDNWIVRLDIVEVGSAPHPYQAVSGVRLGQNAATQAARNPTWWVDLRNASSPLLALDLPVNILFSDGTSGMIALGGPRPMMPEQEILQNESR